MHFEGLCYPTGIGSIPISDPKEGCDFIREYFKEIPFWPQLPNRTFLENMYTQYIENVPGAAIKEDTFFIKLQELVDGAEGFYEKYLEEKPELFNMSAEYAAGYDMFKKDLANAESSYALKGQITGPVSFCMQVVDENKKALLYDDTAKDILIKNLLRNAQLQEKALKHFSDNVIMFLDEPYLVMFGSAFSNLTKEDVREMLEEILSGLSCITAIHCCGNTDWSILLDTSVDILSFDAFNFAENLVLYPDSLKAFLNRGGNIAWGMVPTDAEIVRAASVEDMHKKMEKAFHAVERLGISKEKIIRQSLITPACGVGSLETHDAKVVFQKTKELSESIRKEYF